MSLIPFLSHEEIQQRVTALARLITLSYDGENPVVIPVLKGAFMFAADLIRQLDFPLEVEFVSMSSYGNGTESSGTPVLGSWLPCSLTGRDLLVVEDIVDTGHTINYLLRWLKLMRPESVRVVTLLNKPSRRKEDVFIAYAGFSVEDRFVVGYGLDYAGHHRNLPGIYYMEEI